MYTYLLENEDVYNRRIHAQLPLHTSVLIYHTTVHTILSVCTLVVRLPVSWFHPIYQLTLRAMCAHVVLLALCASRTLCSWGVECGSAGARVGCTMALGLTVLFSTDLLCPTLWSVCVHSSASCHHNCSCPPSARERGQSERHQLWRRSLIPSSVTRSTNSRCTRPCRKMSMHLMVRAVGTRAQVPPRLLGARLHRMAVERKKKA